RGDRFARPGFADQRHGFAAAHGEADAVDGGNQLAFGTETDAQVADVEDGVGIHKACGSDGPGRCPGPRDIWGKMKGGGAHLKVFRGSKASRMPSKMNTSSDSMMAKVKKAAKPSHGACRFCFACSASSPREGAEAGSP